MYQRHNA